MLAEEYAKRHGEELVTEALETIERWRTQGFFGKRAQAFQNVLRLAPPLAAQAQSVRKG